MPYTWEGKYRSGKIIVNEKTKPELDKTLDELGIESSQVNIIAQPQDSNGNPSPDYPAIAGALGPSAAIMAAMTSSWGRSEPRGESEITQVLKINAIFFTQGSISGTLTYLVKTGRLRRIPKGDKFAYTPAAEALVTA